MTTVPTSSDEAKKLGEDLIKKKGGLVLAKLTGMHMCTPLPVNEHTSRHKQTHAPHAVSSVMTAHAQAAICDRWHDHDCANNGG